MTDSCPYTADDQTQLTPMEPCAFWRAVFVWSYTVNGGRLAPRPRVAASCDALQEGSHTMSAQSHDHRLPYPRDGSPGPAPDEFEIRGVLDDGSTARASFVGGVLHCDEALRRRAELLVAMEERFANPQVLTRYGATLEGPATAVALTLIRSMHVLSFDISLSGLSIRQRCEEVDAS